MKSSFLSCVAAAALALRTFSAASPVQIPLQTDSNADGHGTPRPNFVLFLMDTQNTGLDVFDNLPSVRQYITDKGEIFQRRPASSRLNIWTARQHWRKQAASYYHAPDFSIFRSEEINNNYLPRWLEDAGYSNFYAGKFLDGYCQETYGNPFPAGFNDSDFLLDSCDRQWISPTFQRNRGPPEVFPDQSSIDLIGQRAVSYVRDASTAQKPFFLTVSPRLNRFALDGSENDQNHFFARGLRAIDRVVDDVVRSLEENKMMDQTYIMFTSFGDASLHRTDSGSRETDESVPFVIRGPGMSKRAVEDLTLDDIDIAPTILDLASLPPRPDAHGSSIAALNYQMRGALGKRTNATHKHKKVHHTCAPPSGVLNSLWCHAKHEFYVWDASSLFVVGFGFGMFISIAITLTYKSFWRRRRFL